MGKVWQRKGIRSSTPTGGEYRFHTTAHAPSAPQRRCSSTSKTTRH